MADPADIPKLDLRDAASGEAERGQTFDSALRDALVHFGFVRIEGHGIDPELISSVYADFAHFFSLEESEKRKSESAVGGQRGYTPFGVEHAKDQAAADLKAFFHVGRELAPDHPLARVYPPNVWPEVPTTLRAHSLALYDALDRCAATLLASLERSCALPPGTLSRMLVDGNSILRALHYPPVPPVPPSTAGAAGVRAAAHEDINLITLLCEATDAGLEIQGRDGSWLPVPALPGEIVVDAGDMLSRVTNDVIPATTHRVVTPEGSEQRDRYSLPFFAHPAPDCDLSVLPQFVPAGEAPKHAPITAGAFLQERLREIGLLDWGPKAEPKVSTS